MTKRSRKAGTQTTMRLGEQREGGRCGSCQEVSINGVRCHEHGCPEALRFRCTECGTVHQNIGAAYECCGEPIEQV